MNNTLSVYQGEVFERGRAWWIGAITIAVGMLILALFGSYWSRGGSKTITNWDTILNAVVLFALFVGYVLRIQNHERRRVDMSANDGGVSVGSVIFSRDQLTGYVLEIDIRADRIKNIVLVQENKHHIFTVDETDEKKIVQFLNILENYCFRLDVYHQSGIEKLMRKLKV